MRSELISKIMKRSSLANQRHILELTQGEDAFMNALHCFALFHPLYASWPFKWTDIKRHSSITGTGFHGTVARDPTWAWPLSRRMNYNLDDNKEKMPNISCQCFHGGRHQRIKGFVQNQAKSNKLCRNMRQSQHKMKMCHNILKAGRFFFMPKEK